MPDIVTINTIQRITGIIAFTLITLQIFLSSNRKFTKFHMLNGILAYTFIFVHPIMMILYRYSYMGDFDPFYVYTDVCVLCNGEYEHFVNLGRIAFYLVTITVLTAKFRDKIHKWVGKNWRKLHILNYLVFYLVSVHAINIGTDSTNKLFLYFFWFCQIVVLYSITKRVREYYISRGNVN